ncbi:hypothetical protein C8K30_108195 [Promicromonospora sp. AC04]|uniref:hypothetical protein n=1 Tax=Promicromonospora sp. AC04 TaxID=2135723 RepID=UPI000D445AEF|nr:hypothetical protein [Promicromonospora sp. AC04]PUB24938.1 hypothetical protein C8K30_108195 [Promicromonospora sp. AC04]
MSRSRPTARNTEIQSGTDPAPITPAPAAFSARERWTLLGASLWLVAGLQLDAFAHATIPDLETFWTPWHAVMYSGIAACGVTLLWLLRSRLPEVVTYRSLLRETPSALRLPGIGMGLLLVGGGIDTLWHNLFGIERGLEIFFSPSHYFIIAGMVLVASGPALMLAASSPSSERRIRGGDAVTMVVSAVLAAIPVHIYTLHASAIWGPQLGTGEPEPNTFSLDAQMLHGYVGSTVLLLVPVLLLARRWQLPVGAPTALIAIPAFMMNVVFGDGVGIWLPITLTAAAVVTELVARALAPRFRLLTPDTRWMVLGTLAPMAVWGVVLGVSPVVDDGVSWNLHLITGLLALVGITGAGTAFVVRRIQVAPAQGPTAAAPTTPDLAATAQ